MNCKSHHYLKDKISLLKVSTAPLKQVSLEIYEPYKRYNNKNNKIRVKR